MREIMKFIKPILIVTALFLLAYLLEIGEDHVNLPIFAVHPVAETHAISHLEDVDDLCVWVHPTDPSLSTVIGTDKGHGLAVYDLQGSELQFMPVGRMNNIDIRSEFPFQDKKIDLIAATNRTKNNILLFTVNPENRQLIALPQVPIKPDMLEVYGLCMYKSRSNHFYVFVTSIDGMVEQWELFDNKDDRVGAQLVRKIKVSSQSEGCVADDELGFFYLAEEKVGIWKYNAEPKGEAKGKLIAKRGPILNPDIEGLTIYYGPEPGTGYLIASIQSRDRYAILDRAGDNPFIALFEIIDSAEIDGTQKNGWDRRRPEEFWREIPPRRVCRSGWEK